MHFLLQIIKGFFIGAGAILPGISSGVICVIFGLYEKIVDSVLGFFTNVKNNLKFLLPIIIGLLIGIIVFGKILRYVFFNYNIYVSFLFIGLILGSIPKLINQINIKNINFLQIIIFLLAFLFSIYFVILEKNHKPLETNSASFISFIFAGFVMSAGVIIPGVSSTVILMLLGKYESYLNAISSLDFNILVPLVAGLVLGSLLFLYIIRFLLKKYKEATYLAIIGFTLGSMPVLLPTIPNYVALLVGLITCFLGLFLGLILSAKY